MHSIQSPTQKTILVIRLSSLGDAAITVPLIEQLSRNYPQSRFIFLIKQGFTPLLNRQPYVHIYPFDPYKKHKGFLGLYKLYRDLKKLQIDQIADLHNVIRSKILRIFFYFSKIPTAIIDKGRKGKKALTRQEKKRLIPLKPTIERYADVFRKLGFQIELSHELPEKKTSRQTVYEKKEKRIGIAPFTHFQEKRYPLYKMEKVISLLNEKNVKIILFGGGPDEEKQAIQWAEEFNNVNNLVAKLTLDEELNIIRLLDVMFSMDSANMHLASMVGTRVLSIWGATHPYAGFYGYGQNTQDAIQIDLECRPCSIFGNKACWRKDHACMELISEERITNQLLDIIGYNN